MDLFYNAPEPTRGQSIDVVRWPGPATLLLWAYSGTDRRVDSIAFYRLCFTYYAGTANCHFCTVYIYLCNDQMLLDIAISTCILTN